MPSTNSVPDFSEDARCAAPTGMLLTVPVSALRPTQLAVGMQQVEEKKQKIVDKQLLKKPKKLDKFLLKHVIPAVRGPGGDLYIIDHHHLGSALYQLGVPEVYATVIADLSNLSLDDFWKEMLARKYIWCHDELGNTLPLGEFVKKLPRSFPGLKDDPYRSLAALVRKAGGYTKDWTPFSEFHWANFFRSKIAMGDNAPVTALVSLGIQHSRHPTASHLPGFLAR